MKIETIRTTIRFPPKLHKKLEDYCKEKEKTMASVVRDSVRKYLKWKSK